MKICFLSLSHLYNDNRIFQKEARSLVQAGFEVIHLAPGDGKNHRVQGVQIEFYPQSSGLKGRLVKFFRLYQRAVRLNADCYHCNEVESWLVGCLIKLFHRKKRIIFDVHEHYPSRFDDPRFPTWMGWIGEPAIRWLFRLLTPWTDHVIFAKRSVAPDFPGSEHKQTFLFNYSPLWLQTRKREMVSLEIREQLPKGPIAIHVGAFAKIRGWPQLLRAMTLMKHQELQVVCLGKLVEGKETLLEEAQRLKVSDRIHLYDSVPYEQMFDFLLCADMGLMLYQPGIQNHVFAFPIKMYDYMLAGLPVVGPDFAVEVTPVILEEECGLLVNTAKPEEIASALDWLCENPRKAVEMGCRGRQAVVRQYNWESEAGKLIEIYRNLQLSG